MQLTAQQTEKLLKGNYTFSLWSLSMLVTKLKGTYANSPSPDTLGSCVGELNAFVAKFNKIMGDDITIITKL